MIEPTFLNVGAGLGLVTFAGWAGHRWDATDTIVSVLLAGIVARFALDVPPGIVGMALTIGAISRYLAYEKNKV